MIQTLIFFGHRTLPLMTAPFSAHLPHGPFIDFIEFHHSHARPSSISSNFHHFHARPSSISSNFHHSRARPSPIAQNLILAAWRFSINLLFQNDENFNFSRPSYPPPHDGSVFCAPPARALTHFIKLPPLPHGPPVHVIQFSPLSRAPLIDFSEFSPLPAHPSLFIVTFTFIFILSDRISSASNLILSYPILFCCCSCHLSSSHCPIFTLTFFIFIFISIVSCLVLSWLSYFVFCILSLVLVFVIVFVCAFCLILS